MKKILAFAGSNSSTSINHQLVQYAASKMVGHQVKVVRLTDFPLPLFSEDLEREKGYPIELSLLKNEIAAVDALLISVNEHNGTVSAFFKNTMDWLSRLEYKFLIDKKVLLMSTSNGKRGALSALEYTKGVLPRYGGTVIESFAFPSFSENFSVEKKEITNEVLQLGFIDVLQNFAHEIDV
ncbi:MAG: NAD(P)H-dependent oxidoreductase [Altibacter sp.]|uniref:NADPH-dependent FMN reductase n=1 Tax=Altibacter sp. TaxID=2024823 RepID=UPI001DE7158E|nr:NAD(P)H-dependent oxidoreductase [Altibacter sp.]MBZ0328227.1 NAD(P)H-dependent oxidoreductase [Altibacter sp.]